MWSTKAHILSNLLVAAFWILWATGCSVPQASSSQADKEPNQYLSNRFAVEPQKAPPKDIQSLQLHPTNNSDAPPVIVLNSGQQLLLSFDDMSEENRQFRIEVSHRSRQWEASPIAPSFYLDGFSYHYIQQSKQSLTENPTYRHISYTFPNDQLRPKVSGNYLLNVYDRSGNDLLFSLPFFISENKGSVQSRVETIFAQREDGRSEAQLFSTYRYPDFVDFPQFDLSIRYIQNRFWGRSRAANSLTTIGRGRLSGRLKRSHAFVADYEFKHLDLRDFDADSRQIIAFQPGFEPPNIILRRDIQGFDTSPRFFPNKTFGQPLSARNSRYAQVHFSLETAKHMSPDQNIYLVGGFNNWMIGKQNKMQFDEVDDLWKGEALIKQGEYAYKYVSVTSNGIDDLSLDQSFQSPQQEYLTFIYFKDPNRKFDRLLKVGKTITRQ